MLYQNVYVNSIGYELAPNVVSSEDLEERLAPLYKKFHLQIGQIEALTGIAERRFWDIEHTMHEKAALAGRKALESSGIPVSDIGMLVYGGVCRDNLEPATACAVAYELGVSQETIIYDISNACLGALNGMLQVANAIELGQIKAGLVVSCESSRQIIESTIEKMITQPNMENFKLSIATMTGGSGAVGIVLSSSPDGHRLAGGALLNATEHHKLCRWGPNTGMPASGLHTMETDSVNVLKHGIILGQKTFRAFRKDVGWEQPDKVICHQVGSAHQNTILKSLEIDPAKDFVTYPFLGNIGTVSLPLTAAIASEREFLQKGDRVAFLGIGSGLNCLMLGLEW